MLSLRTRVLLGAVLWTAGLFFLTGIVTSMLMIRYPHSPRILHSMFEHSVASSTVALLCMLAGLWQVKKGLSALHELRSRLAGVRGGHARRIRRDLSC